MKYGFRLILAMALGLTGTFVSASEPGPARAELERFATGLDTFQAEFTQTVQSQDGRVQDQTRGHAWLQSPDKLRWVYAGDFPETIVADGDNVWIYDESLDQVTVEPQTGQASDSPLMILADVSQLDRQFHVTELGDFEDMLLLELKSLSSDAEFERILLGLDKSGIRMMAMEDAFGQRTEVQFEKTQRNPQVDPSLFKFTPPADADVVGTASVSD